MADINGGMGMFGEDASGVFFEDGLAADLVWAEFFEPVAAGNNITGSASLTFTPTASIIGRGQVTASSTLTFAPTGTVTGKGALSGSTAPVFTTAGTLRGLVAASGSTTLTFTTSATGITVGALSGASAAAFTTAGTIAGAGSLSGAVTTAFTAAGALGGAAPLSGVSNLAFTTSGLLAGSGALSGASSAAFTVSGLLEDVGGELSAISGAADISFTASGTLTGTSETQSLHGRPVRRRGKIVRFADEIDPPIAFVTATERKEALAEYGDLIERVRELTAQFVAGQRRRQSEAKQAALQAKIDATAARIEQLTQAEQNWINRLREEDELFLLAA